MGRILLEKTFEALADAGINPAEVRGSRCGVFIGSCFSEAEKTWFYEQLQPHGFAVTGYFVLHLFFTAIFMIFFCSE